MSNRRIPMLFPDSTLKNFLDDQIYADPFGSYTGLVESRDEKPVQDADDL